MYRYTRHNHGIAAPAVLYADIVFTYRLCCWPHAAAKPGRTRTAHNRSVRDVGWPLPDAQRSKWLTLAGHHKH